MRFETVQNLKYWLGGLAVAAGLIVIGCGGSGGGGTTGGGPGGGTGGTLPGAAGSTTAVDLGTIGSIDVSYVTGAGRAEGDLAGELQRVYFDDALGQANADAKGTPPLNFSAYNPPLTIPVNVRFPTSTMTRRFETFYLDLATLIRDNGPGIPASRFDFDATIPSAFVGQADIRVFPGRRTGVSVFLDSTMFSVVTGVGATLGRFDRPRFEEINFPIDAPDRSIRGVFNDYLSFDISQITAPRPLMADGNPAGRVFFSGDGYGLGQAGASGSYEGLTPFFTDAGDPIRIEGRFSSPSDLLGRPLPGTYTLLEVDPSDLIGESRLVSLQGHWYEHSQRLLGMSAQEMIAFPSTRDGNIQDVVYFTQNVAPGAGGTNSFTVTNMWFGNIEYNFDTGVHNIFLYPISELVPGGTAGGPALTGTLTGLTGIGAVAVTPEQVRSASYRLSNNATGRMVVYRR